MDWTRELYSLLLIIKLAHGTCVKTRFQRTAGHRGEKDVACTSVAARNSNSLAAKIGPSNTCKSLSWEWGSEPSYDSGATYYEKKHVVEDLNPPLGLNQAMYLPIRFGVGASIDLNITFPTDTYDNGGIILTDSFDEHFDPENPPIETLMVFFETRPTYAIIMSKRQWWTTHVTLAHVSAGSTHTVTFKALADVFQVLFDGQLLDVDIPIVHHVTPDNARMLKMVFDPSGMLNAVKFVGVDH